MEVEEEPLLPLMRNRRNKTRSSYLSFFFGKHKHLPILFSCVRYLYNADFWSASGLLVRPRCHPLQSRTKAPRWMINGIGGNGKNPSFLNVDSYSNLCRCKPTQCRAGVPALRLLVGCPMAISLIIAFTPVSIFVIIIVDNNLLFLSFVVLSLVVHLPYRLSPLLLVSLVFCLLCCLSPLLFVSLVVGPLCYLYPFSSVSLVVCCLFCTAPAVLL